MNGPEQQAEVTTSGAAVEGQSVAGSDPNLGAFDYGIVGVSVLVVLVSFYLAARYLLRPGERGESHIKRTVLEEER